MTDVLTATCASCGAQIYGTRFCEKCGTPVATNVSLAPTSPGISSAAPQNPFGPGAGAVSGAPYGDTPPRRPLSRRGRVIVGISIGVIVALVAAGGGAWWYFSSKLGGAASPEAAAVKLVSSFQNMDPVGIYGSLAPSEVSEVSQAFQKLSNAHPKNDGVNIQDDLASLKSALTITTTGVAYRTDKLADGVERVVWTKGSIKIVGNSKKLANVLVDLEAPAIRAADEQRGESKTNIDRDIASARKGYAHNANVHQTFTASKAGGLSIIVVDEGSGWYVSPILTIADLEFRSYAQYSDQGTNKSFLDAAAAHDADSRYLGSTVADAGNFSTPEAAAKALANAAVDTDSLHLAATLSLPERRLVSVYGPWVEKDIDNAGGPSKAYGTLAIKAAQFSSTISGQQAKIRIDNLDVTDTRYDNELNQNLTSDFQIQGTCASLTGQTEVDNGYDSDSGWVSDPQVGSTSWHGCFSDVPALSRLGFSNLSLVAVQENGRWLVSPFATTSNAISIVTDKFLGYYNSGRLKQLFAN
jgi:hypothetical protein